MKAPNPFASYDISLQAMPNGEHSYSYELGADFFGLFEASLIHQAQIEVELRIHRLGSRLDCQFDANGTVQVAVPAVWSLWIGLFRITLSWWSN